MSGIRGFEFIAGCLALNFVDTLTDRGRAEVELLATPQLLRGWAREVGLVDSQSAPITELQLSDAQALREAIFRCAVAVMELRELDAADTAVLNRAASRSPRHPELHDGRLRYVADAPLAAMFSEIAADALSLIATERAARIRRCPGCAMVFEDTSRPGSRRWCSSARGCGNKAKTRNLRERRRVSQVGG